jgi:hypothetical protein
MKPKEEWLGTVGEAGNTKLSALLDSVQQDAFESGRKEGMTEAMELPASYFGGRKFINAQAIKEARDRKGRT